MSKIFGSIVVNAPTQKVWEVLADYGSVSNYSPIVTSVTIVGDQDQGVGAERACQVKGFGEVHEKVVNWQTGDGYTIEVKGLGPIKLALSTWRLVQEAEGQTHASLEINYQVRFGPLGVLLNAVMMRRMLGKNLHQLLGGLKSYVETGEPVNS